LPPVTTIHINEVESSGGTPGDWVELVNTGGTPVDISGWRVLDNDDTHVPSVVASGTIVAPGGYFIVEEAALGFGLGAADSVRLFDAAGAPYETYSWTSHAATSYGRCPNGTGAFTATTTVTKAAANDCTTAVRINEVESSGGTPGDWIELFNAGGATADVGGYTVLDNDDAHTPYAIPAGTTIPAGGRIVLDEAAFGFGLGSADNVRLFGPGGAQVDTYSWTAHASTTYGRCPDGTGSFTTTSTPTKGTTNSCPGDVVTSPWPGGAAVTTADPASVLGGNMSGLVYEGSGGATPGVLWAAKNGPGTLHRLVFDGATWAPDAAGDWGPGKALRYANGTGDPDAEGVTFAAGGSAAGIYVATERNNAANGVSRNAVLRFDPAASGTTLTATHEWDLTADLPVVGPNLGMEAITWVPDADLVAGGFKDQSTGAVYHPSDYPDHGTGLFFVGLEANGTVYAYALDQSGTTFHRVATISSGFVGVMDLQYDRDLDRLWAVCDDGCQGRSTIMAIDGSGAYVPTTVFDRPAGMANLNNEGFAVAASSECSGGTKPAFWADDSATDAHAIRTGTVSCT
jgi:hypothetical protein